MKELTVVQADGGYIIKGTDPEKGVFLKVKPNFGATVKEARAFFGEEKKKDENDPV